MMGAMLRTVLEVVGIGALVVACRMEAMDLEGPPEPEGSQAAQPDAQPASASTPASTPAQSPAQTSPGPATTPRRPARTPTPASSSSSSQGGAEGGRFTGITAAHNKVRAELGLPALVWTPALAKFAQAWADKLQKRGCELQHRPSRGADAQKYGENIYWASGIKSSVDEVVGDWVAERKNFNAKANSCKGVCGHYTQVVWRRSVRLGCGMATCGDAEVWVCNYDPPGNFMGERPF